MLINQVTKTKYANRALSRRCSECGSTELITDEQSGEIICGGCGLVVNDVMLNQNQEWRAFTPEERNERTRVGSPSTLQKFDKGLSTTFQPYTDIHGKTLPSDEKYKMMRLKRWQNRASRDTSTLHNLSRAMNDISTLSDKLNIPTDISENAAQIYRKILDARLVRGRSIKNIAAASLYAACRLTRVPRSLIAVSKASNLSKKDVSRCYRLIRSSLNIRMPIDDPIKYVPKISSKVGVSQKTQNQAIRILKKTGEKKENAGKAPIGLAAAAIYMAYILNPAEHKVTQKKLADAAEVTEVTVRNRYKGLAKVLKLDDITNI